MHAVVKTGGKQYRVQPGDVLKVEKIADAVEGSEYIFREVLAVGEGDSIRVGAPKVEGAAVRATVLENGRHKKVIVFKKKRRKGYKKKRGHRQHFTKIQITGVDA